MVSMFYGVTRLVGKAVEEVITAPEQIANGVMDAIDEALDK